MTTLRLPAVFSDHVVLCRDHAIRIWGEAESGRKISVSLGANQASTIARKAAFSLSLSQMPAGGPYELTITDGVTTLVYYDVLIGDVYLAGGQSNMALELQDSDNGKMLVRNASNRNIRYYQTPRRARLDDQALQSEREYGWRVLEPEICGDISAVAYHFAVRLQKQLNIPVGIIGCNWGGTSITCWIEESVLQTMSQGQYYIKRYAEQLGNKTREQCDWEERQYNALVEEWNDRVSEIRRTNLTIPWENINACAGDYPWPPPVTDQSPRRPGGLAQTMLKRIAPFTLTGILYYQGEEDASNATMYLTLLTQLVQYWRALFEDENLPFLLVQLPMYIGRDQIEKRDWPVIRHAQERVSHILAHVGLAVLIDLGEFDNLHPTDKQSVGERLYWQAMKVIYHLPLQGDGPCALAKYCMENAILVELDQCVHCSEDTPALLEVAAVGKPYKPAKAELCCNGQILRLTCDGVAKPVFARYAWVNYGKVNLFGSTGLPLAPFAL